MLERTMKASNQTKQILQLFHFYFCTALSQTNTIHSLE